MFRCIVAPSVALLLVPIGLACSGSRETEDSRGRVAPAQAPNRSAAEASSPPLEGVQAMSEALRALEAHLAPGETYGEGPDATVIAAAAREAVAPGDGVAVKVVPGNPRHVTVLVRYRSNGGYENLRDISQAERNQELDRILEAIDIGYEAGADVIGLAIRGPVAYGAIAIRHPRQRVEHHTGRVISTAALNTTLMASAAEEPSRAIVPGQAPIEGRLSPPPNPQPFHHVTLEEPRAIRVQLRSDLPEIQAPVVLLCRGAVRAGQCDDSRVVAPTENVPDDVLDQQTRWFEEAEARGGFFSEDVYRLPAGTYTLAIFRGDCPEDQVDCPANDADYDLRLF